MDTLDFKKQYRELYAARPEPVLLTVPELPYLISRRNHRWSPPPDHHRIR